MQVKVKVARVYEDRERHGDYRVLVDRLWPRGFHKAEIDFDEWAKEITPSTELRRGYGHDPERFGDFASGYRGELSAPRAVETLQRLAAKAVSGVEVTLLTATGDLGHSAAAVLAQVLGELIAAQYHQGLDPGQPSQ